MFGTISGEIFGRGGNREKQLTATKVAGRKTTPRNEIAVMEVPSRFAAFAILTFVRLSC